MTPPSIEAIGLTKRYNSFVALDHLSLKIEGAKCVGFLGPNGAGKTTTLKMLTDMIFPTEGEARINGISVREDRRRALSSCGVLIETPEIYPSLTPREALSMVGDLRGYHWTDRNARIDEVLAEVKMSDWADKKVGKFSKGMKQRVNVASALLSDPEVLLLDEPTTGLDPRGMAEVRDIIRELKRGRRLIFMSSHILSEVSDVCDEVALVNKGKLLFHDTLSNVTARFTAGQTSIDVGFARPVDDGLLNRTLGALAGVASWQWVEPLRARVHFTGGPGTVEKLFEELAQLRLGIVSFRESSSALEDVYMKQVEKGD